MSWQDLFATRIGPGALCGIKFGDWMRLLSSNGFAVDPPYWARGAMITAGSLQNSVFACYERWRYDAAVRGAEPYPPLFILGVWRSGTTHLHNLLARDERFAFPDFFEVFYPHTFLSMGWGYRWLLARFLPEHRPQDQVRMAVDEPQEDEFALNCMTQMSWALLWTLPRNASAYERYLTFRDCTQQEIERWQAALRWFVKKLTYRHHKPLVLKSPAHTGRLRMLLEIFPEARFIHIHRNPYDVFQSSIHSALKAVPYWTLQRPDFRGLEERTLAQYVEVYDAYFEDKCTIPAGRLSEVPYERLVSDPIAELRRLYQALDLGDFAPAEPALRSYLSSIGDYQKNKFERLDSYWKDEVARRCRRNFEAWNYDF
jgi:hypothetical protein